MRESSDKATLWPHRANSARLDRNFPVGSEPCRFVACLASAQDQALHRERSNNMRFYHGLRAISFFAIALAQFAFPSAGTSQVAPNQPIKNIILVHGAWADGSSWSKLIPLLQAKGLHVVCVQNPLTSFADDVAATKRIIDAQDGPVLLVGHSYGGAVITEEQMTMFATEGPTQGAALGGTISTPAWRSKPTWFVIASNDRMITPQQEKDSAQKMNAKTLTLPTSHVPMLSRPKEESAFLSDAATARYS